MERPADILQKTIHSKEYKALTKCAKQCDKFTEILEKEVEIVNKIKDLTNSKKNGESFDTIIQRANELTKLTREMTQLYTKKEGLLCAMDKCANEMADVQIKKNELAIEMLKKTEKSFDDALKKMAKKKKQVK